MSNSDIKVSVIMPIYNAYNYLRPALDSVLDQTLREIEVICIDDGSTDRSLEIIKSYQESDSRVRIATENNAGQSTARNKGIIRTRGEYMIFLDADDFYEPTLLENLYSAAVEHSLDIVATEFDIYNEKTAKFSPAIEEEHGGIFTHGKVISKSEHPDYIFQCMTGYVWNKLFRTAFIKEKELTFAPELYVFEDVHFVCAALSLAERVGAVPGVNVHHRVYSDQSRAKRFKKYFNQVPVVYLKIKEFLTQHGVYIPLMKSYLNLSASRCYKIYNLLWSDAKSDFWDLLHNGYADSLGWFSQLASDFESADVGDFVANVGLYTHSQYEKRQNKGKTLKIDTFTATGFEKKVKKARKRDRFMDFLRGIKEKAKKRKELKRARKEEKKAVKQEKSKH